ncbi:MAG: glycoside hydrolase family 26 protein [Saccharofermentans sp.]|nr:glycoside hydrolase family 26 protein [Saccharofermentans sp.]
MFVDNREPAAIALLERLEDISYSDYILFGHQNAGHIGVSITAKDGTQSDVKNLVGKHPGVIGIDTLSFFGYEGKMEDLVKVVKQLYKEGVIITLSSHMPNFSLGGKEYIDYTPNMTDGNVGERLLPGGDLNAKYIRFLNNIAKFAQLCVDINGERIPMIFRPFHESNGHWFWWGAEHLSDEKFIQLFRYTIDYLRNDKGIRNFLYSYSPNGVIDSEEQYMARYPGDDYVDILGFDMYWDRPKEGDIFLSQINTALEIISDIAQEHGKTYAVTEIGIRTLESGGQGYYEGLAPSGNSIKDWFTRLLNSLWSVEAGKRCAFVLTWANFSDTQFWVPYAKDDFRHEMCDDFVKFCEDDRVKLAP